MKLRYYLRGLGIGIIVTALVMGIADRDARPLTDAEIKAKALALGMVESDSIRLGDVAGTSAPSSGSGEKEADAAAQHGGEKETSTVSGTDAETAAGTVSGTDGEPEAGGAASSGTDREPEAGEAESAGTNRESEAGGPESAGTDQESEAGEASEGQTVTITIEYGTGSGTVCRLLEEAGLIEDANSFDRYLIRNGYSKKIRVGTCEIPIGATEEEIAGIITR